MLKQARTWLIYMQHGLRKGGQIGGMGILELMSKTIFFIQDLIWIQPLTETTLMRAKPCKTPMNYGVRI